MTEDEKKELYEWYKKVYDYDPDDEGIKIRYSKEIEEEIKKI